MKIVALHRRRPLSWHASHSVINAGTAFRPMVRRVANHELIGITKRHYNSLLTESEGFACGFGGADPGPQEGSGRRRTVMRFSWHIMGLLVGMAALPAHGQQTPIVVAAARWSSGC